MLVFFLVFSSVMCQDLFSDEELNAILQTRCNNANIKNISATMKPISEDAEGLMGEHYKLKIKYSLDGEQKEANFFVKTKPKNNKLQEESANEAGFRLPERQTVFDLDKLQCMLKSLAMYHAAGFAYERTKSKELVKPFCLGQEYYDVLDDVHFTQYRGMKGRLLDWWNTSFDTMDKLVDELPKDEEYKKEFKKLLKNNTVGKIFVTETKYPKTTTHGDLWSNNMMFKFDGAKACSCCLVDYQISRYFYPAFDVILAIHYNTDAAYRKKYKDELYQYYYNTLGAILEKYEYNLAEIMSLEDFYETIKLVSVDALTQVVSVLLVINMPKETLTGYVNQGSDSLADAMFFKKDVLSVDAYRKYPVFKKIVDESLSDLRDAM